MYSRQEKKAIRHEKKLKFVGSESFTALHSGLYEAVEACLVLSESNVICDKRISREWRQNVWLSSPWMNGGASGRAPATKGRIVTGNCLGRTPSWCVSNRQPKVEDSKGDYVWSPVAYEWCVIFIYHKPWWWSVLLRSGDTGNTNTGTGGGFFDKDLTPIELGGAYGAAV